MTSTEILLFAAGILAGFIGAYFGASQASEKAARVVRPTLVVVVVLLVLRLVTDQTAPEPNAPDHFYRKVRLIAALLIATLVPFAIDRYARRSSRIIS